MTSVNYDMLRTKFPLDQVDLGSDEKVLALAPFKPKIDEFMRRVNKR